MRSNVLLSAMLTGLLALASAGCIPYRVVQSPGAVGRVIDGQTKRPIADALISRKVATRKHSLVRSSAEGQFLLRPVVEMHWQPLLPAVSFRGPVYPQDSFIISAGGYAPREITLKGYWLDREAVHARDVELERLY